MAFSTIYTLLHSSCVFWVPIWCICLDVHCRLKLSRCRKHISFFPNFRLWLFCICWHHRWSPFFLVCPTPVLMSIICNWSVNRTAFSCTPLWKTTPLSLIKLYFVFWSDGPQIWAGLISKTKSLLTLTPESSDAMWPERRGSSPCTPCCVMGILWGSAPDSREPLEKWDKLFSCTWQVLKVLNSALTTASLSSDFPISHLSSFTAFQNIATKILITLHWL